MVEAQKGGRQMAFDFKKDCKELYAPKAAPSIITAPPAHFIAIEGQGDPNQEGGRIPAGRGRVVRSGVYLEDEL